MKPERLYQPKIVVKVSPEEAEEFNKLAVCESAVTKLIAEIVKHFEGKEIAIGMWVTLKKKYSPDDLDIEFSYDHVLGILEGFDKGQNEANKMFARFRDETAARKYYEEKFGVKKSE